MNYGRVRKPAVHRLALDHRADRVEACVHHPVALLDRKISRALPKLVAHILIGALFQQ